MSNKELISQNRTLIMGISMLAVLLFHQPWFYGHIVDNFFYYYGSWGVDFFLFVSGFGISHSLDNNSNKKYYWNRIKRIVPYCLVFGIIRATLYYNGIQGFVRTFHPSTGLVACSLDLWYIYAIIIYYTIAPIVHKILSRLGIYLIIIFVLIAVAYNYLCLPDYFNEYLLLRRIPWVLDRLPVFCLGMYSYNYINRFNQEKLIAMGVILMLSAMVFKFFDFSKLVSDNILFFVCFATPGISLLIAKNSNIIKKWRLMPFFNWLGKNSLYIYLTHEFIFRSFNNYLPLNGMVSLVLSMLMVYIIVLFTNFIKDKN